MVFFITFSGFYDLATRWRKKGTWKSVLMPKSTALNRKLSKTFRSIKVIDSDDFRRFTMLLLEPGEIFFEDYSVQMQLQDSASDRSRWTDGRLKLCSKSLVFVSKDINQPLIKVQLKEAAATEKHGSNNNLTGSRGFSYFIILMIPR